MRHLLLSAISITLLYGIAFAAPSVTGSSGTFVSGQSVTITGASFSTKSPAAPIKWTSFEEGTNGDYLYSHDTSWCAYTNGVSSCGAGGDGMFGMSYSNNSPASGTLHASSHITSAQGFITNFYVLSTPANELFVSYKWKYRDYDDTFTVTKLTRLNSSTAAGGGGYYNGVGKTVEEYVGTLPATWTNLYYDAGSGDVTTAGTSGLNLDNNWHKINVYKKLSSPAGTANGVVGFWVDGQHSDIYTGLTTRNTGQTFQLDTVLLGSMDGAATPGDYYIDIDDVYIDNTLSRVEICTGATWADRGTCEIQIPSAWSDTSVTVTVNQGAFADSSSQYLYVVDSTGDGGTGRQITFGSSSSPTPTSGLTGVTTSGCTIR